LLTLGFATGLRRSNLVGLDLADVVDVPHKGLAVTVRAGKTGQEGRGQVIAVYRGMRAETCPVRALRAWLVERGRWAGPLLPRVQGWVSAVGMEASAYGAHSLRAGFVTAAYNSGTDTVAIMETTGHRRVDTVRGYLRNVDPFAAGNPLARAL
jgi:integrase